MKVLFFGAGKYADIALREIETATPIYTDQYLAVADNNKELWGEYLYGKKIISPADINDCKADLIVIMSNLYQDAIRIQLTDELSIFHKKIYTWPEYKRLCYCKEKYRKSYGDAEKNKRNQSTVRENIVIYTAITGNYDSLKEPLFTGENLTYVCFTNNHEIKSRVWNIEYINNDTMDDVHLARRIKLNPHLYFHDYELSIWVDGKYQVMDDLGTYISQYRKQSGILCFPHPERECICDELAMCILYTAGNNKDMITQVSDYLNMGYPVKHGLYDTGCIVRYHNDIEVKALMNEWENEINKYSFRDQLSFPYICWKNGYMPDICDLDINRNNWLLQKRTLY